jgi:hypothetical protein
MWRWDTRATTALPVIPRWRPHESWPGHTTLAVLTQWHREGRWRRKVSHAIGQPVARLPPLLIVARNATAVQLGNREVTWLRFLLRTPAW